MTNVNILSQLVGKMAEVEHEEMTLKGRGTKSYKGTVITFTNSILTLDTREFILNDITRIDFYEGNEDTYNQIYITRNNTFKTVIYFE